MLKSQFAEQFLLLFTTRERAASIVGDLAEAGRGDVWFWTSLLRTSFSLLWRDLAAEPVFMTGLAFRTTLYNLALTLGAMVMMLLAVVVFAIIWVQTRSLVGGIPRALEPIVGYAGFAGEAALTFAVQFRVGQWLARRAPGRELAALVSFILFNIAFWKALEIVVSNYFHDFLTAFLKNLHGPEADMPVGLIILMGGAGYLALFAGTCRSRLRAVA